MEGEEEEADGKRMCQAPTEVSLGEFQDTTAIVSIGRGGSVVI